MLKQLTLLITLTMLGSAVLAAEEHVLVQSTTSTQNSGLLDYLMPKFTEKTGIEVRVVAVGTGQALRNARNGDGDVLLVHAKNAEAQFVTDGFGIRRFDLMYNDFVIVGPRNDPADVGSARNISDAMQRIEYAKARFISRGDDSGTHKKETALWSISEVDAISASGTWYREIGSGMGATLNMASGMDAYTLTDRATWISFKNKNNLVIVFEGDEALFNQYGVIAVNPVKHPSVNIAGARELINWLIGPEGQSAIAAFEVSQQQLFHPNAE